MLKTMISKMRVILLFVVLLSVGLTSADMDISEKGTDSVQIGGAAIENITGFGILKGEKILYLDRLYEKCKIGVSVGFTNQSTTDRIDIYLLLSDEKVWEHHGIIPTTDELDFKDELNRIILNKCSCDNCSIRKDIKGVEYCIVPIYVYIDSPATVDLSTLEEEVRFIQPPRNDTIENNTEKEPAPRQGGFEKNSEGGIENNVLNKSTGNPNEPEPENAQNFERSYMNWPGELIPYVLGLLAISALIWFGRKPIRDLISITGKQAEGVTAKYVITEDSLAYLGSEDLIMIGKRNIRFAVPEEVYSRYAARFGEYIIPVKTQATGRSYDVPPSFRDSILIAMQKRIPLVSEDMKTREICLKEGVETFNYFGFYEKLSKMSK